MNTAAAKTTPELSKSDKTEVSFGVNCFTMSEEENESRRMGLGESTYPSFHCVEDTFCNA